MNSNDCVLGTAQSDHKAIRMATLADLDALVSLEQACFAVPWSRKSFEAELHGNAFSKILIIPATPGEQLEIPLLAFICVWVIFEEIRFLNLAVHPQFRGQGLARQLILQALCLGNAQGCRRGMLEVRDSNVAARKLYECFNFKEYGQRKSYYTNPSEDAILMMLEPIFNPFSENKYP
ncbi:MAG: ribosomal protein S18-alanine N-acetyltransferase [Nitrospira sp.]|nr:ribosomal protein S18-alanine N-acetyltransferase [Nitrospira sp.]HBP89162.1 ribosomal-protein-alanine N-acetyltransferase [Nitrospiraceae bacterium]HNP28054.1 ribosomal protein S18-alanine N-acetyltransferase [Nitrospirales bacterium]